MQHVNGLGAAGQINNTVRAAVVRDANLFDTFAHNGQRFEIVWRVSALHLVQLVAGIVPGILGELAQAPELVTEEPHRPHE
jgi:hypothetical protein